MEIIYLEKPLLGYVFILIAAACFAGLLLIARSRSGRRNRIILAFVLAAAMILTLVLSASYFRFFYGVEFGDQGKIVLLRLSPMPSIRLARSQVDDIMSMCGKDETGRLYGCRLEVYTRDGAILHSVITRRRREMREIILAFSKMSRDLGRKEGGSQ